MPQLHLLCGTSAHAVDDHAPVHTTKCMLDPADGVVEVVEKVIVRMVVNRHAEVLDGAWVSVRRFSHDGNDVRDVQLPEYRRGGSGIEVADKESGSDLAGLGKEGR